MKKVSIAILGALLVSGLSGCAASPAESATHESPKAQALENPYGGFPVEPPAADEIVLTIVGPKETDEYTMNQLEKLVTDPVTIFEPFVKAEQTFSGVPLKTLFEAAGISSNDKISTLALNAYKYDDTAGNFTSNRGILALRRGSQLIPMDQGGPIRIIFPTNTKYFSFLDAWNWSLRSIKVIE